MPCANNKGTDQPAQPHSLISALVVRCLDNVIPLISIHENFMPLPSFCGCSGQFESYLVANSGDRFSPDEARL